MKNLILGVALILGTVILVPSFGAGQTRALGSMSAFDDGGPGQRLDLLEQVPTDTVVESNPNHPFVYTVPTGQSLVVTYFRGGDTSTIGGAIVGNGAVNLGRLVLNEGETFMGGTTPGGTPIMCGYLIGKTKAPGVAVHVTGAAYTVPTGMTLYITHVYAGVNPSPAGQIDIDGKNVIPLATAPLGENVFIPVAAGKIVNATATASFHGYLK